MPLPGLSHAINSLLTYLLTYLPGCTANADRNDLLVPRVEV